MIRLLDVLLESKIMEMPLRRLEVKNKFRSYQDNIGDEILKILMYKDSKNQNHWRGKLNGYLKTLHRVYRKKPLSSNTIMSILYNEPLGSIDDFKYNIEYLEDDYYKPSYHIDYDNLPSFQLRVKAIYKQIVNDFIDNKIPNINNYIQ